MGLDLHVVSATGPVPQLRWRWDAETDILSGSFTPRVGKAGHTGTVELNDEEGAIAVIDVVGGVLCGLDVVVWPEVVVLPRLAPPVEAQDGMVVVPSRAARRGTAALEFDTALAVTTDLTEEIFHLRIGTRRAVEPVRVANRLLVEVDASHRLAGFWLEEVPSLPAPT